MLRPRVSQGRQSSGEQGGASSAGQPGSQSSGESASGQPERWHSFHVVGRAATRRLILGWAAVGRHPVRGRRALRQSSVRWIGTLDRRWCVRRIPALDRRWCARRIHAVERGWRVRRIRASSRRWHLGWSHCDRRARDSRCGRSPGRGAPRLAWSAGDRCTGHRCAGFSRNRVVARMRLGAAVRRPPRARHRPGKDKGRRERRSPAETRPPPAAVGRRVARRNKAAHRAAARRATRVRRARVGPAADR